MHCRRRWGSKCTRPLTTLSKIFFLAFDPILGSQCVRSLFLLPLLCRRRAQYGHRASAWLRHTQIVPARNVIVVGPFGSAYGYRHAVAPALHSCWVGLALAPRKWRRAPWF